jgi:uridine kinase
MDQPRTIIVGISGCSSSGKTTLARLLRDMFPETFILHEDDFYKAESEYNLLLSTPFRAISNKFTQDSPSNMGSPTGTAPRPSPSPT